MSVRFRIRLAGQGIVAGTEGPNAESAIWSYAMQYRADGEVTIQHNAEGHWKRHALLAQWPNPKVKA
ncbi:hypothetical protein CP157_01120 [Paracoccus marcusii]|uniref:hypothetical protein n=1 Tax=Paracoccus marcusii TaxID=59779 RepID=UPI001C3D63A2|nr:hypothetical protein [Paracoccus marcusii]QXI63402.1 hypothetical protein CP157_01120 [Paracoccus marcusii]